MDENVNLAICLLCTKPADRNAIEGVLGNPEMCSLLSIATGNTIERDPTLPNVLCRNCLLQTNLQLEYQHRIYANLMKLRINHFIRNGDHQRAREMTDSLKQSRPIYFMNPTTQQRCRSSRKIIDESLINAMHDVSDECSSTTTNNNNNNTSIVINDVRTIHGSPRATPVPSSSNFNYHTDDADMRSVVSSSSDSPEQLDVSSLLVVTHEQHENISVTESGGDLHLRNEQQTQQEIRHECSFCKKSYRRARYLEKHLRKHNALTRARERLLSVSERNPHYQCSHLDCREEFSTLQLFRSHSKKHKIKYPCMTCPEVFTHKNESTWHNLQCGIRTKVLNDVKEGVKRPLRARTRSMCLLESTQSSISCASSDVCSADSLYLQRVARASKSRENANEDGLSESVISDTDASSCGTSNSSAVRRKILKEAREKYKSEKRKAKRLGANFYRCSVCSFGSRLLTETMRHEQQYHDLLLNFYCNLCKDWYTTRENLIRHRKKHKERRRCDFCEQIIDSQFNLEYHLLLHYEKSFDCKFCHMSFIKEVNLTEHILEQHRREAPVKHTKMIRCGSPRKIYRPITFRRYKSKILLQKPSANATILPLHRAELVLRITRSTHSQLDKEAGIRKPGVNMCGQHHESFSNVESERDDFEAGRQECNAPPSLFADYTVSPLSFDRTDDTETFVTETYDQMKPDPDVNPVLTIDDGVYDVLDDMKVFFTEPLRASSDVVATTNNLESDVIVIEDSDDDVNNPVGCISLPTRQPHKKKRRTLKIDLPIKIGERFIPSYEEYVPKEIITNGRLVEQIAIVPPLNRPFRYIT